MTRDNPKIFLSYGGPIICDLRYRRGFLGEKNVLFNHHFKRLVSGGIKIFPMPVRNINDIYLVVSDIYDSNGNFLLIDSLEEIKLLLEKNDDKIGILFCLGPPHTGEDPHVIDTYCQLGVSIFSMTHNRRNIFAEGCAEKGDGGLSSLGKELVQKLSEAGIIIDISHISERSFWDILEITKAPVIATHSNSRRVCNHPRNLTDEQIKAIAERKGIIGINFYPNLVSEENPEINDIISHIHYIMELVGEDFIALGPDFQDFALEVIVPLLKHSDPHQEFYEGSKIFPRGAEDVTKLPEFIKMLKNNNFSSETIERICYKNMLSVFADHCSKRMHYQNKIRIDYK